MTERSFGRLVIPDSRDAGFPMRGLLRAGPLRLWRYWWDSGWWGDQGSTFQCVAYAWAHWLEDGPVTQRAVPPPCVVPQSLYEEAKEHDEWPGTNYEGTSVRAGAKVLKRMGLIASYHWAWDVETVVEAVLNLGPVVVGTNWYAGMDEPDHLDMIQARGVVYGGHAYVVNGVNLKRGVVRVKNSWGRSWAGDGRALMSIEDLERLIREDGEACIAVEAK